MVKNNNSKRKKTKWQYFVTGTIVVEYAAFVLAKSKKDAIEIFRNDDVGVLDAYIASGTPHDDVDIDNVEKLPKKEWINKK